MYPPSWVLTGATRLDLDQFGAEFSSAWSRMQSRFLKLECWQRYREAAENASQVAYERGDVDAARELLQQEADTDRLLYQEVQRRSIEYARVRLVQEPLTPYLRYELLSYRIRAQLGETIEMVRCDPALRLPNDQYFDFLLFDQHTALIHDYGTEEIGLQTGGWATQDPTTVAALEATIIALRQGAEPLHQYLTKV